MIGGLWFAWPTILILPWLAARRAHERRSLRRLRAELNDLLDAREPY